MTPTTDAVPTRLFRYSLRLMSQGDQLAALIRDRDPTDSFAVIDARIDALSRQYNRMAALVRRYAVRQHARGVIDDDQLESTLRQAAPVVSLPDKPDPEDY